MKALTVKTAVISILLLLFLSTAHAGDWTGNISGYVGQKSLDDSDWSQLDSQVAVGLILDLKQSNWPLRIAFDTIGSGDVHEHGSQKDEGYTLENHLGIRKVFEFNDLPVKPYLGGGIALVYGELKKKEGAVTVSDDDRALGGWIGGGLYFELTSHINLGLDLRYSQAEVTLFDLDREAGGIHAGVTAGYHW